MVIDDFNNEQRRTGHLALLCFTGQLNGLKFGVALAPTDKTLNKNKRH